MLSYSLSMTELIEAEVISVQLFTTARGKRLYALFRLLPNKPIGIWTNADDYISCLQPGDRVIFRHSGGTKYEFVAKTE